MSNLLEEQSGSRKWQVMVAAAKSGAAAAGYQIKRVPGRGLSNVWEVTKGGKTVLASIRTTRDRWIAFQPLNDGKNWKTLDDVELVVVAAVDSKENPENVEVYIFSAADVRKRFDAAYAARVNDGQVLRNNFGLWVNLDRDARGIAASVGSGLSDVYEVTATYSIKELLDEKADETMAAQVEDEAPDGSVCAPTTIPEVMRWAREHVAKIAGVSTEAVKLELKIEY